MTSQSSVLPLDPKELRNYGFARVRDIAFDAVQTLWRRRRSEGLKQSDIVKAIDRQPAWVSRNLRAPGNWTLRTIGELVEALGGEVEIVVRAKEDPLENPSNYSAYIDYDRAGASATAIEGAVQVIGAKATSTSLSGGQVIG
jgi:hypothetical protein